MAGFPKRRMKKKQRWTQRSLVLSSDGRLRGGRPPVPSTPVPATLLLGFCLKRRFPHSKSLAVTFVFVRLSSRLTVLGTGQAVYGVSFHGHLPPMFLTVGRGLRVGGGKVPSRHVRVHTVTTTRRPRPRG